MEFSNSIGTDPFNIKFAEFEVSFYLGTKVQYHYIDKLIRCMKKEIQCRPKCIKR